MTKACDITPVNCSLYFLPVETRLPLKFGPETLTSVTCARVRMSVQGPEGQIVDGWGETPLSVQWVWPSQLSCTERHIALKNFCLKLAGAWGTFGQSGHAIEIGHAFQKEILPALLTDFNKRRGHAEPMSWLAALVCCSAFDIALHDAYGVANQKPSYQTYASPYMNADLSHYLRPAEGTNIDIKGKYPAEFFVEKPKVRVMLASKISEEDCTGFNLGYMDPTNLRVDNWKDRAYAGSCMFQKQVKSFIG